MLALALLLAAGELGPPEDCFVRETRGGTPVVRYIGDRACVPLRPPEEMTGVWFNVFEGSSFVEGSTNPRAEAPGLAPVWLNVHEGAVWPPGVQKPARWGRAYKVRLIGRKAADMNRKPRQGYGHFNMSPGLVVVDRILSIEDIGPAQPR